MSREMCPKCGKILPPMEIGKGTIGEDGETRFAVTRYVCPCLFFTVETQDQEVGA